MKYLIIILKELIFWLLDSKRRNDGLRNGVKFLVAAQEISKITKSNKDDVFIRKAKKQLESLLSDLPEEVAKKAVDNINKNSKTFNVGYDKKKGVSGGIVIKF